MDATKGAELSFLRNQLKTMYRRTACLEVTREADSNFLRDLKSDYIRAILRKITVIDGVLAVYPSDYADQARVKAIRAEVGSLANFFDYVQWVNESASSPPAVREEPRPNGALQFIILGLSTDREGRSNLDHLAILYSEDAEDLKVGPKRARVIFHVRTIQLAWAKIRIKLLTASGIVAFIEWLLKRLL